MLSKVSLVSEKAIEGLKHSYLDDVFSVLGLHKLSDGDNLVRAFLPNADAVEVIRKYDNEPVGQLSHCGEDVFAGKVSLQLGEAYLLKITYGDYQDIREDPYRFPSTVGEQDLFWFGEGTHEQLYHWMGAQLMEIDGVQGVRFVVWAPNAQRVSVVGEFNYWDGRQHIMRRLIPSGVWELFIPGIAEGVLYKYEIKTKDGHVLPHKSDPYGFAAQKPPETASRVVNIDNYQWGDEQWMQKRYLHSALDKPISIYEVHLGSWRRKLEGGKDSYLSYRDLADQLVPYVLSMGFTHIQLMPISEFPFDGSWGYQPVGLYSPTSRFGSPQDFMAFIDACHQAGIGVLVDWVPGHFPSDGHGLARFDGSPLYEHADDRQGFHPDWNTYIFNYGRCEVANYLYSNALFWFEKFHVDGLRVDAVASMLYLDYSRNDGEWVPNCYGGRENLEAIDLIKRVNQKVYERFPDVMMVAEESTAWPGVSHPVYAGGLGFGYKWNMGWMNDTLRYMSNDPIHRRFHHHDMTFSLLYAFNENFILPLSHDEVVHGKRSLLDKMPGDGDQKFANLRAYLGYMWTHPGKKLLFMGGEFAQGREWNHDASLDWHLLELDCHQGIQNFVKDLNRVYREFPALHGSDTKSKGFEWVEADDTHNSVFAFIRKVDGEKPLMVVCNLTPVLREEFRMGVPCEGYYREILNSDAALYGGGDRGNAGGCNAEPISSHRFNWSISLTLPPLSTLVFELQ